MSSLRLPVALITYLEGFVQPSDLGPLAAINKDWQSGTILRLRSCAANAVHIFKGFLLEHLEFDVHTRFFSQYRIEQFQMSCSFGRCNSLKDIQFQNEVTRRAIEEVLLEVVEHQELWDDVIEGWDEKIKDSFLFGFEKTFFLLLNSKKLKQIPFELCSEGAPREVREIVRTLTAHGCGIRALQVMNEHSALSRGHDWSVLKTIQERMKSYTALARGFVDRGDFRAAYRLADCIPSCLSREIRGLSGEELELAYTQIKLFITDAIFESSALKMIQEERYDEAIEIIDNISNPLLKEDLIARVEIYRT